MKIISSKYTFTFSAIVLLCSFIVVSALKAQTLNDTIMGAHGKNRKILSRVINSMNSFCSSYNDSLNHWDVTANELHPMISELIKIQYNSDSIRFSYLFRKKYFTVTHQSLPTIAGLKTSMQIDSAFLDKLNEMEFKTNNAVDLNQRIKYKGNVMDTTVNDNHNNLIGDLTSAGKGIDNEIRKAISTTCYYYNDQVDSFVTCNLHSINDEINTEERNIMNNLKKIKGYEIHSKVLEEYARFIAGAQQLEKTLPKRYISKKRRT